MSDINDRYEEIKKMMSDLDGISSNFNSVIATDDIPFIPVEPTHALPIFWNFISEIDMENEKYRKLKYD